jgi:hypothetical protein
MLADAFRDIEFDALITDRRLYLLTRELHSFGKELRLSAHNNFVDFGGIGATDDFEIRVVATLA